MTGFVINDTWPYPMVMGFQPPAPGFVSFNLVQRYAELHLDQFNIFHRYSDSYSSFNVFHRYADASQLRFQLQHRYRDLSVAFVAAIGTQLPQPSNAFGVPPPGIAPSGLPVTAPGTEFSWGIRIYATQASTGTTLLLNDPAQSNVESFTFSTKKNSGSNFSMKLAYDFGSLSQSEISNIEALLSEQNFAGDDNIDITIIVQVQVADQIVDLPPLVVLQKDFDEDENGWTWNVTGIDWLTRMLNKRNLNLNSYVSGPESIGGDGQIWMATQILSNFLPQFGINNFIFNFDDYPIRTLHIQNTRPIDIVNQVLWVPRAYWWSDGMTLRTQPWAIISSPNWVYQDQPNLVMKLVESTQSIELINTVKVNLSVPAYMKGATITGDKWGQYTATFPPIRTPLTQWEIASNGFAQSVDFFDTNGHWVAHFPATSPSSPNGYIVLPSSVGNGAFIGNTAMIASVSLVWAPPPTAFEVTATGTGFIAANSNEATLFKVNFRGADLLGPLFDQFIPPTSGPYVMPSEITNFSNVFVNGVATTQTPTGTTGTDVSQQFSIVVEDSASVGKYGVLEAEHPIENALIPNLAWAWRVGINTLVESGRLKSTYRVTAPLNPLLKVGDTVQVIESAKYINVTGLIEEVTVNADSNEATSEFFMTVYTS
jgi:hypothetical protein